MLVLGSIVGGGRVGVCIRRFIRRVLGGRGELGV